MPSFAIEGLADRSVDLFINRVSLGEMTRVTAFRYVEQICRVTRQFFFHFNHDGRLSRYLYSDGSRGPLAHEYPVADEFKLLMRYPEMNHLFRLGTLDFDEDVFIHLFERTRG